VYQQGEVLSSSITCQVMFRINMLAFRVPSYCCVVASSWGWGLFRLPSRVLFFPSRVPPSAFCCVAFRLSLCRVPPSAFCLLPRVPCFFLFCCLLPVWWSCLCLARLASVGFVSEGGRRGAAAPFFVRFSFSSRHQDDPRQREAQEANDDDQGLDHASPRLVRASCLVFFSPLLVLLLARAFFFSFLPRLSAASCLVVTRDLTRPAPCGTLLGADGERPRRQTRKETRHDRPQRQTHDLDPHRRRSGVRRRLWTPRRPGLGVRRVRGRQEGLRRPRQDVGERGSRRQRRRRRGKRRRDLLDRRGDPEPRVPGRPVSRNAPRGVAPGSAPGA